MSQKWVRDESIELINLAQLVAPEGEGLDLADKEYSMAKIAELRSYMSSQRSAIDRVGAALTAVWESEFKDEQYDDGINTWSIGRTKGKVVIDDDQFYKWLATKDADQLAKLISATAVKVGGMSVVERETLLDETPRTDRLSIKYKLNNT